MTALNTVAEMLQRVQRNLEKVGSHSREEISRSDGKEVQRLAALEKRMDLLEKENDLKLRGLAAAVKLKLEEISRAKN